MQETLDLIFDQNRPRLFAIAYRMVGTVADAEDLLQETFLRFHEAQPQDVKSPRAYLTTILTRLCINHLESARVKREEYAGPWLPEPLITEQDIFGDKESLSFAFLIMLEKLSPIERAIFLLHEIFDFNYAEITEVIGKSEANCRQILSRARKHMASNATRSKPSPKDHAELLLAFLQACENGNTDGLLKILSGQITLHSDGGGKVPSAIHPILGSDRVARFLIGVMKKRPENINLHLCELNGAPGVVVSIGNRPISAMTFDARRSEIETIFIVNNPDKLQSLASLQ